MSTGTLYGIGIGPGDPDLITVKGAKILADCSCVFVPRAPKGDESLALSIARRHIPAHCTVIMIDFSMTRDRAARDAHWDRTAREIADRLETGGDACYLTLGDTLLYSTYIYMLQALQRHLPEVSVRTIPGITSFSAAAARTGFALGAEDGPVVILPVGDNLDRIRSAVSLGGTVVLMKIGKSLDRVLDLLDDMGLMDHSVFAARVGLDREHIETDLRKLRGAPPETGNLGVILVHAGTEAGS